MSFKLSTGNVAVPSASTEVTASDGDSCTIKITAGCYLTNGWTQSTGVVAKFYVDGTLKSTQTILGNGTKYTAPTKKTVTYSYTVTRSKSSKTSAWKVQFHQYTDGTDQGMKVYLNGSRTIAAKTSYTVTFKANGGTGAPANQTKWYGEALTLSSTKPTRTGYTFKGWSTSSTATSATYSAGGTVAAGTNSALTLYAVWSVNSYTITFNGNGGTSTTKSGNYGSTITLPTSTRSGYTFKGWSTSATGSVAYAGEESYTVSGAKTLYAVWELAYWNPKMSGFKAERCNSDGKLNDFGTYLYVTLNFECCTITNASNSLAKVSFEWTGDSTPEKEFTNTASYVTSGTTTKGSFGAVIGGSFNTETSYTLSTTITDVVGGSFSYSKAIPVAQWPFDIYGGTDSGVAFGKVAELADYMDVAYTSRFRMPAEFVNAKGIMGIDTGGVARHNIQPNNAKNRVVIGHGNYDGNVANSGTDIFGNEITLSSRDGKLIKANAPIEHHAMTCTCSSDLSLTTTSAKVIMGDVGHTSGNLLTGYDGGIKCAVDGYVLVAATAYAQDLTAGHTAACTIRKNSTALSLSVANTSNYKYAAANWQTSILKVNAGDVIYLYAHNVNGSNGKVYASVRSKLTVMYIG